MRVLIWRDKHGTSLYDATTPEALDKSARRVVRSLLDQQYIYQPSEPDEPYGVDMELATLTDEQIDSLPTESLRDQARNERRKLQRANAEYEDELETWTTANKLAAGEKVVDDRGREETAWGFLQTRNGYEYEEFDIERVWTGE